MCRKMTDWAELGYQCRYRMSGIRQARSWVVKQEISDAERYNFISHMIKSNRAQRREGSEYPAQFQEAMTFH